MRSVEPSMVPFLERLERHSQLLPDERRAFLKLPYEPLHLRANEDFMQRREAVSHSCFIFDGLVGTFGQNKLGGRQITSVFLRGDMVDLQTVVIPEAPASIQTMTQATILKVPHGELRKAAAGHPGLAEAFWRQCVIEAAVLSEWVINVGRRDARSRLAHLFCEIACRAGQPTENRFSFEFPIAQHQLADMLGLTPVHVNRTLKGLREDRILDMVHRMVQILDWNRLVHIGEFDPAYLRLKPTESMGCEPLRVVWKAPSAN